jgi:hypothetical protein
MGFLLQCSMQNAIFYDSCYFFKPFAVVGEPVQSHEPGGAEGTCPPVLLRGFTRQGDAVLHLFLFIFPFFKINNSLVSDKHCFCFDQEKYDDMYGEVFMAYFAAGALNISSFDMSTFVPKMLSDKSGNMDKQSQGVNTEHLFFCFLLC